MNNYQRQTIEEMRQELAAEGIDDIRTPAAEMLFRKKDSVNYYLQLLADMRREIAGQSNGVTHTNSFVDGSENDELLVKLANREYPHEYVTVGYTSTQSFPRPTARGFTRVVELSDGRRVKINHTSPPTRYAVSVVFMLAECPQKTQEAYIENVAHIAYSHLSTTVIRDIAYELEQDIVDVVCAGGTKWDVFRRIIFQAVRDAWILDLFIEINKRYPQSADVGKFFENVTNGTYTFVDNPIPIEDDRFIAIEPTDTFTHTEMENKALKLARSLNLVGGDCTYYRDNDCWRVKNGDEIVATIDISLLVDSVVGRFSSRDIHWRTSDDMTRLKAYITQ